MRWVKAEIEAAYPGIFIHSIVISKTERADRAASFYDDLNRQVQMHTYLRMLNRINTIYLFTLQIG